MSHDFCPDCGHLLSNAPVPCMYCGWLQNDDHFLRKGFDSAPESVLVFDLTDDGVSGRELGL